MMNDWTAITEEVKPKEGQLVLISGHFLGTPGSGRWYALARQVAGFYISEDTQEELFPPTHFQIVQGPAE